MGWTPGGRRKRWPLWCQQGRLGVSHFQVGPTQAVRALVTCPSSVTVTRYQRPGEV